MVVRKDELHILVERLQEHDQKTVYEFLQYLIERSERKLTGWAEIDKAKPDEEPLTEKELHHLKSDDGYVTGEEAKHEFGLQVDLT